MVQVENVRGRVGIVRSPELQNTILLYIMSKNLPFVVDVTYTVKLLNDATKTTPVKHAYSHENRLTESSSKVIDENTLNSSWKTYIAFVPMLFTFHTLFFIRFSLSFLLFLKYSFSGYSTTVPTALINVEDFLLSSVQLYGVFFFSLQFCLFRTMLSYPNTGIINFLLKIIELSVSIITH